MLILINKLQVDHSDELSGAYDKTTTTMVFDNTQSEQVADIYPNKAIHRSKPQIYKSDTAVTAPCN